MEVCYLRESLLRSTTSPLLSFLAPAVSPAWRPMSPPLSSRHTLSHHTPSQSQRLFSAQSRHKAKGPPSSMPSGGPSKRPESIADILNDTRGRQPPSAMSSKKTDKTDMKPRINAKFDELFPPKTGLSSPSPSSATDVADAYRSFLDTKGTGVRSGSIAGSMLMPGTSNSSSLVERQVLANISDTAGVGRRNKRTVRPRPTVGRTVEVEEKMGVDFGQAIRKLSILLTINKVRNDQKMQKYHERAGAKRKRLKGERWRRYFKEGFQATIGRVKQMRRQGW